MRATAETPALLLSVPPPMARVFAELEPEWAANCFAASDPPGRRLGSGGGTAHLLTAAWQATGGGRSFGQWLPQSRKLLIHGGGQSRRLPAYAAVGKLFVPLPVLRWSLGGRLSQTLLDLQLPLYRKILAAAPPSTVAMLASGDVLLRGDGPLPALTAADVVVIGLWVSPEQAQHHGVFFCPRQQPERLAFALQKPSLDRIRDLAADYLFLIDSGVWLLSERAVAVLLRKCGWDEQRQQFAGGTVQPYELYAEMGPGLGDNPTLHDPEINALRSVVLPLPTGKFYHLGTNRDLIQSVSSLQNLVVDQTKLGLASAKPHPDQHTQNAAVAAELRPQHHSLWIENSVIPATWRLSHDHVLTGVPENAWSLALEPGVSLDFVPLDAGHCGLRFYGIDDPFRGALDDPRARWLGRPATEWFAARGLDGELAQLGPATDLQSAPLFPVVQTAELDGAWIEWLTAARPAPAPALAQRWQTARRLSAHELGERVDLPLLDQQRRRNRERVLLPLARNHRHSIFYKLDLESTARLYGASALELPPELPATAEVEPMKRVHDRMFRAAVLRCRGNGEASRHEADAFALLRDLILHEVELQPVRPARQMLEDQIVWGRCPVRLDLGGGWTDTPPYCLEHGGRVVNLAADLNAQPPIQVFARVLDQAELRIRSIDLGLEERVRTYEELACCGQVGSGFTVAKAAFALAGFLPRFQSGGHAASLAAQLTEFGGGLEVAMLCAVPKGSGLGTSSILAAALLGTLSEVCGLQWDHHDLFHRTLALEQMLTTGGGWQDQAGGLLRGLKLIETAAGLAQRPVVRWLPEYFFSRDYADKTVLLYYTGLTRVAKEILKEIVRGLFLNSRTHLQLLEEIGQNAASIADAIQKADWDGLCQGVRRSWDLNQRLDGGTNPPPVQAILDQVDDYLAAAKLLGAGGGGYLLMFAKDDEAARRIRQTLAAKPPNARARFVGLSLSATGFQVTRS